MGGEITQDQVQAYMELTEDYNPLHCDPEFAAQTPFGKPIVYGTLVLNSVWLALEKAGIDPWSTSLDIKFLRPVYVGNSLRVEVKGDVIEVFEALSDKPVIGITMVK